MTSMSTSMEKDLRAAAGDQSAQGAASDVCASAQPMSASAQALPASAQAAAGALAAAPMAGQTQASDARQLALCRAMIQIMREIGAIAKEQECSTNKGSYKFRGIDSVYQNMHWALARNGIFLQMEPVPGSLRERECAERGRPARLVQLDIRYTFVHELGGSISSVVTGEAAGYDDKVISKAQSCAYKRLMFDTFCVPLANQMPDESQREMELDTNGSRMLAQRLALLLVQVFFADAAALGKYLGDRFAQANVPCDPDGLQAWLAQADARSLRAWLDMARADFAARLPLCRRIKDMRRQMFGNDYSLMLKSLCAWLGRPLPDGDARKASAALLAGLDDQLLAEYIEAAGAQTRELQALRQKLDKICASRFGGDRDKLHADMASYFHLPADDLLCLDNAQLGEYLGNFPEGEHARLLERCAAAVGKDFANMREALRHASRFTGARVQTFSQLSNRQMELWLEEVEDEANARAWLTRICDQRFGGDRKKLLADMSGFLGCEVASLDQAEREQIEGYIQAQRDILSGPEFEGFWDMKEEE